MLCNFAGAAQQFPNAEKTYLISSSNQIKFGHSPSQRCRKDRNICRVFSTPWWRGTHVQKPREAAPLEMRRTFAFPCSIHCSIQLKLESVGNIPKARSNHVCRSLLNTKCSKEAFYLPTASKGSRLPDSHGFPLFLPPIFSIPHMWPRKMRDGNFHSWSERRKMMGSDWDKGKNGHEEIGGKSVKLVVGKKH